MRQQEERQEETAYESISDAAKRTGIAEQHLRRLLKSGVIPGEVCARLGRLYFFHRGRFDAFLEAGGQAYPGGWKREPDAPPAG